MTSADDGLHANILKIVRRPSAFEALDDPEASGTLVDALALEMTPRERDEGFERLSLWGFSDAQQRDHIIAAFLSCRSKADTAVIFLFAEHLLIEARVTFEHDTDPKSYACIQNLHISADFEDPSARIAFAAQLVEQHRSGQWTPHDGLKRIKKSEIVAFIHNALNTCDEGTASQIRESLPAWLQHSRPT